MERLEIRRFSITPFKDACAKAHPSLNGHTPKAVLSSEIVATITATFDKHVERLIKLKAQLPSYEVETNPQPQPVHHSHILPQTVAAVDRLLNPPLLPAPKQPAFEEAFKPFEAMFHTVFYRRYHPIIREDMKQVALIALFKKWRKDPGFLSNNPSYVVTAAIFGVGNWRQKQMKMVRNEARLHVDDHDKVIGATQAQREHDAWAIPIDRRIDVELARSAVLFQHPNEPEREWATTIVGRLKLGHSRITGTFKSRVKKRQFLAVKDTVLDTLRSKLADYAPAPASGVIFDAKVP